MPSPIPDYDFSFEHFTLNQLDRIVPIGESRPLGEALLTLLSLECYHVGFVALTLFEQDHPPLPESPQTPDTWEPPLLIRSTPVFSDVLDDLGNHYVARQRAGAGGGTGPNRVGVRFVHCFTPALDPAALTLTFTMVQLGPLRYDADGAPTWEASDVLGGPWTVSFALPEAEDVGQ